MRPQNPLYRRGDIVLALYPNSNLSGAKTRPALIIQADGIQTGFSQYVVAMITSQMSRAGHPSRVSVLAYTQEGIQSGLLVDSVVMTDNLATVTNSVISRRIGSIPMTAVDLALRYTLNL